MSEAGAECWQRSRGSSLVCKRLSKLALRFRTVMMVGLRALTCFKCSGLARAVPERLLRVLVAKG